MVVALSPPGDTGVDEPAEDDDGEEGKAEALREATDPFLERHHHSPMVEGRKTPEKDALK